MCIRDRHRVVEVPASNLKKEITKILFEKGYILNYKFVEDGPQGTIKAVSYTHLVVMNPVDHPMGGGEGRASGGHPRSRKGLYAKGLKKRAPKKQSSKYIIERRKK